MKFIIFFSLLFVVSSAMIVQPPPKLKFVCYYTFRGFQSGNLVPERIDPNLCTHIIFGYAYMVNSSMVPATSSEKLAFKQLGDLKQKNRNLKLILSVDDGTSKHMEFTKMISNKANRSKFISNAIKFIRSLEFDGIDFDWEFPVLKSGEISDRENFATFLSEMKNAAVLEAQETRQDALLVTVAVSAISTLMDICYDIPSMSESVDVISIMCYDYHGYRKAFPFTGHNSPLYSKKGEEGLFGQFNTEWSANAWNRMGATKDKLVIGIPTYGQKFSLLNPEKHGLNVATTGGVEIDYSVICGFLNGATKVKDSEAMVPFAFKNNDWMSYEDEDSAKAKTSWVVENGFAGVMSFSLNADDWQNACNRTEFPLHKVIHNTLFK